MNGVIVGLFLLMGVMGIFALLKSFLFICRPSELLIISGRSHKLKDGSVEGYRIIRAGRAFRIPVLETVSRMDLTIMPVDISIHGAYSRGGIPLNVLAIANVKVSSEESLSHNAIERFLGRDRREIRQVAKETLEGHLRGVLANLTPEEVNEDRLKFAGQLTSQAKEDLDKLGLQLDTLKIQNVSDDTNYLASIGRERIALVIRDAEMAESDATNEAERFEADWKSKADVADANAEAVIARQRNQIRKIQADFNAKIRSSEERATASGREARMIAEEELQKVRAELEQLRLRADVILPAEANRRAKELEAIGYAARVKEEGRAMEETMTSLSTAWKRAGDGAADMMVIRQLEDVLSRVADAVDSMDVGDVSLIDSGDGKALPAYVASYPAMVTAILQEIRNAVGVDFLGTMGIQEDTQ